MRNSPNRLLATIFGAVYLVVGILGWFVTAGVPFAGTEGHLLILFAVNPLHNIVHLLIGAVLLIAGLSSATAAKGANVTVGVVYLVVGLVGLFVLSSPINILALNVGDNILHLVSAIVLIAIGVSFDKKVPQGARDAV